MSEGVVTKQDEIDAAYAFLTCSGRVNLANDATATRYCRG
jgi:hypothetical protein